MTIKSENTKYFILIGKEAEALFRIFFYMNYSW